MYKKTGFKEILIQHYMIPVKRGYFNREGRHYEVPIAFPAAFLDLHGYIIFQNLTDMKNATGIKFGAKIIVDGGIKSLMGYTCFSAPIANWNGIRSADHNKYCSPKVRLNDRTIRRPNGNVGRCGLGGESLVSGIPSELENK